jgi:L-fuconolactonase
MIVDAHVHFWDPRRGDDILIVQRDASMRHRFFPSDLQPFLHRHGIERCVVMQSAPHEDETRHLLSITAGLPWIHGIVGWSDLESPDFSDRLRALQVLGPILGLRVMLHRLDDAAWITRPAVIRSLHVLADAGLSLDMVMATPHLEPVRQALVQVPALRAIVNHGATPPIGSDAMSSWSNGITSLAKDTGAWCKFSGLLEAALPQTSLAAVLPSAEHLWRCFGPRRLLFASNWPCCDRVTGFDAWWNDFHALMDHLQVVPKDLDAVLGSNALQAYCIPEIAATSTSTTHAA